MKPIDRTTRVFFDASCLIAAAGSSTGGSAFVLSLCTRRLLQGIVSHPVLVEAHRNIAGKLPAQAQQRFVRLVEEAALTVVPLSARDLRPDHRAAVGDKDSHVLAAAGIAGAEFVLTLDKELRERINHAGVAHLALTPGEFITQILPQHVDFFRLRD